MKCKNFEKRTAYTKEFADIRNAALTGILASLNPMDSYGQYSNYTNKEGSIDSISIDAYNFAVHITNNLWFKESE